MAMIKVYNNMALIAVIINIAFVSPTFEHKIEVVSNNINVSLYVLYKIQSNNPIRDYCFFHHANTNNFEYV